MDTEQGLELSGIQIRYLEATPSSSVKWVLAIVLAASLLIALADALGGGGID